MIYKNPNLCESVGLVGIDADEFLESIGVELYDEHISINGMIMEGCIGEDILAENGIFLYEDGIVLEGEQTEKYLRDKERMINSKRDADDAIMSDKYNYAYSIGSRATSGDGYVHGKVISSRNPSTDSNPAYDKGRKMRQYRNNYPNAMPKGKTKYEKDLEKAENKERESIKYGDDLADEYGSNRSGYERQMIADKGRKHYRKTHKNDSTINDSTILENLKFI